MYALLFTLYDTAPQVNIAVYKMLAETYHLPSVEALLISLDDEVDFQTDKSTQVYYLENLKETSRRHVFSIRFKTNPDSHEFTALFISLEDNKEVHTLTMNFPSRGDRHCSTKILALLKTTKMPPVDFEVSGYGERDTLRYIREHSLSAFKWNDVLNRYLHVTDRPQEIREVKKGMTNL